MFRLRMPGGYITAANDAVRDSFCAPHTNPREAIRSRAPFWTLIGDAPPLVGYGPLDHAFGEVLRSQKPAQEVLGIRAPRTQHQRWYDLFLAHLTYASPCEIWVRLLPFPRTVRLVVTDASCTNTRGCPSGGIYIAAQPLLPSTPFSRGQLRPPGIIGHLDAVRTLYHSLIERLGRGASPSLAWREATQDHESASRWVPASISRLFHSRTPRLPRVVLESLRHTLAHPLDAIMLARFVYPAVLAALRQDDDLRYAPIQPVAERDRYLRLQLPLDELIAQEQYLGWLPTQGDYRDERAEVRDELHSS
jgi:hypothetical protein